MHEKEEAARDPSPSLDSFLKEITKMSNTLMSVSSDASTSKETTTELIMTVMAMKERLLEAETCIVHLEEATGD